MLLLFKTTTKDSLGTPPLSLVYMDRDFGEIRTCPCVAKFHLTTIFLAYFSFEWLSALQ